MTLRDEFIDDDPPEAVPRSAAAGLPFCDGAWMNRSARKLSLDLSIRPRRPRKKEGHLNK